MRKLLIFGMFMVCLLAGAARAEQGAEGDVTESAEDGQLEEAPPVPDAAIIAEALLDNGRVMLDIEFEPGSDILMPGSRPFIDEIYEVMHDHPGLKVIVECHTDDVGDAAANQALSKMRAQTLVGLVCEYGIRRERMSAQGFGASRPVADNSTEAGRARNRRIELVRQ